MTQENELDINNQEQNKGKLTHFNEAGEAHMVDVHAKDDTYRVAKACGTIKVNGAVYRAVSTGTAKKGDEIARIYPDKGSYDNKLSEYVPVNATITGIIRGLIREGYYFREGFKIADIDPRESELTNCFTISDKARSIAGSVLEAVSAFEHGVKIY